MSEIKRAATASLNIGRIFGESFDVTDGYIQGKIKGLLDAGRIQRSVNSGCYHLARY